MLERVSEAHRAAPSTLLARYGGATQFGAASGRVFGATQRPIENGKEER
jgi:hypothetical protein